jgi:glycosyltransferase involved in cell wall biosynthesis
MDGLMTGRDLHISVIIPCFDRMELLERTLRAVFAQQTSPDVQWEILVSDNHPNAIAAPLIAQLQPLSPVPLRHIPAPARNIARARNVGVAASHGRLIAFVDDDEAPEPHWLQNFNDCMNRTGADAAFGPKYPVFATGAPPEWDQQAECYTTDFRVPADTQIGRVGRFGRVLGTGNSIMRFDTCLSEPKPFDEQLGQADGEDTDLYFRLLKRGIRFVWCPGAVVHEIMQPSRLSLDYMYARLKRGSRTSARCRMRAADHKLATHLLLTGVGLAQLCLHGALFVLTGEFASTTRAKHRLGIGRGLGKLTYRHGEVAFIAEPQRLPA